MIASYQIVLLYVSNSEIARDVEGQVFADLRSLAIDPGRVHILHNPLPESVSKEAPSVALVVGGSDARTDAGMALLVSALVEATIPIIPLVPFGAHFSDSIPEALHAINAMLWPSRNAAPQVSAWMLRILGLTDRQRRVFVSYRRSDALQMGEQVWEVLTKAGFDVFLDRFGIDPAEDFQERLTDRLGDKGFVLLIESPDSRGSKWVVHEVNYARKHRLGLLALTWPATRNQKRLVEGIFEKYRHYLSDDDLDSHSSVTTLSEEFARTLVDLVEIKHAAAMLRRRRELLGSIINELRRNCIAFTQLTDWTLVVEQATGHRLISVTPRPPETPDLFYLENHANAYDRSPVNYSWLIHSSARSHRDRQSLLEWVLSGRKLGIESEDNIVRLVDSFASPAS